LLLRVGKKGGAKAFMLGGRFVVVELWRALKAEDWKLVKVGAYVVFADVYEGPKRGVVRTVDIKIRDPETGGGWSYPYGLTADSGAVEVEVDGALRTLNLRDLLVYGSASFGRLRKLWEVAQKKKGAYEEALGLYQSQITEMQETAL
jgi:hypothetical protein